MIATVCSDPRHYVPTYIFIYLGLLVWFARRDEWINTCPSSLGTCTVINLFDAMFPCYRSNSQVREKQCETYWLHSTKTFQFFNKLMPYIFFSLFLHFYYELCPDFSSFFYCCRLLLNITYSIIFAGKSESINMPV